MSGDPEKQDVPEPAPGDSESIPVEVIPPDAPADVTVPTPNPTAELEAKVAQLEKDKKEERDKLLRALADVENMRKRTKREIDDARFDTKQKMLKEMLPVVDNLERAIEHAGAEPNPIVEGVQLVLRQFTTAFERLDVNPIEAAGQPFDPNLHEAISQAESDLPPGTVVQVLQRGYRSGDKLLRPALVVVAKAKVAPE